MKRKKNEAFVIIIYILDRIKNEIEVQKQFLKNPKYKNYQKQIKLRLVGMERLLSDIREEMERLDLIFCPSKFKKTMKRKLLESS